MIGEKGRKVGRNGAPLIHAYPCQSALAISFPRAPPITEFPPPLSKRLERDMTYLHVSTLTDMLDTLCIKRRGKLMNRTHCQLLAGIM